MVHACLRLRNMRPTEAMGRISRDGRFRGGCCRLKRNSGRRPTFARRLATTQNGFSGKNSKARLGRYCTNCTRHGLKNLPRMGTPKPSLHWPLPPRACHYRLYDHNINRSKTGKRGVHRWWERASREPRVTKPQRHRDQRRLPPLTTINNQSTRSSLHSITPGLGSTAPHQEQAANV